MFHFVPNLKPHTLHRGSGNRRFDSYLVSVDYATEHRELIPEVLRNGDVLVADNGNVGRIRTLIDRFSAAAKVLDRERKVEEDALGGYARPGQIGRALTARYRALANEVRAAADASLPAPVVSEVVRQQLSLQPTWLVGMEDLSLPCMTALSMEREYSMLPLDWYAQRTAVALEHAQRIDAGAHGAHQSTVFAGLHALDFDTALQAGRMAADAGQVAIASGLVGAMKDRNYVDYRVQEGAIVPLEGTTARPYLRVLEIAAGMQLGYARASGRRLVFHALGPGSPILLPLLGLLATDGTYTSADSTAPIKDAMSSRTIGLYVDEPAPFKLKAHKVALSWLSGGRGWDCECPYCRSFNSDHPPSLDEARRWWAGEGRPKVKASDMWAPGPLADLLPLLGASADPDIRARAGLARSGHNHWVLMRLESDIRERARDLTALRAWVASVVEAYQRFSRSVTWGRAVVEAARVADGVAVAVADADPGRDLP